MVRNITVAAAVASVLASGAAMAQLQPTPAQAASPVVGLYIAGASAPRPAILAALEKSPLFCNGTYSLFSSTGDTNFYAVSCAPTAATGLPGANGTNVFTIWYRDEGGSVVGSLPLVSGSQINQLSLAGASGSAGSYTVAVAGASATNGIDDSFASGVFKAPVQAGVVDQEPTVYTGANYPSTPTAAPSARLRSPARVRPRRPSTCRARRSARSCRATRSTGTTCPIPAAMR